MGAWSAACWPRTLPLRSMSTARVPPVPTSMPRNIGTPEVEEQKRTRRTLRKNAKVAKESKASANTVRESFAYPEGFRASEKENTRDWLLRFVVEGMQSRDVAWGDMVRMRKLA